MPRIPRRLLVGPHSTNHCTFRIHDHSKIFEEPGIAEHFLHLIAHYKAKFGILVHSFCIMGTHPHVTVTSTKGQQDFSCFWKVVNQRLSRHYNKLHDRCGQVVMERLCSPAIQPGGRHMLTVMRYGDLNPVRARLCQSAKEWKHSSYRHYAYGTVHPLIDDAPDYLALGESPLQRRQAYRQFFAAPIQALMRRRKDLSRGPFIGDAVWVESSRRAAGLDPPPPG